MQRSDRREPSALERRILEVGDGVGVFIEYWGFKGILGRIWTLLALRNAPLSQIEIAEFLGVSRSLVSGAIAELTRYGLVRAVSDHRNAPYSAIIDVWSPISAILREREWMLIETVRVSLEATLQELDLAAPAEAALYDRDRLRFLLRMTELAQALLNILINLRVPTRVRGIGSWLASTSRFLKSLRDVR